MCVYFFHILLLFYPHSSLLCFCGVAFYLVREFLCLLYFAVFEPGAFAERTAVGV